MRVAESTKACATVFFVNDGAFPGADYCGGSPLPAYTSTICCAITRTGMLVSCDWRTISSNARTASTENWFIIMPLACPITSRVASADWNSWRLFTTIITPAACVASIAPMASPSVSIAPTVRLKRLRAPAPPRLVNHLHFVESGDDRVGRCYRPIPVVLDQHDVRVVDALNKIDRCSRYPAKCGRNVVAVSDEVAVNATMADSSDGSFSSAAIRALPGRGGLKTLMAAPNSSRLRRPTGESAPGSRVQD